MTNQVSIKDVARLSGVSIATVSRVLNDNGRFSEETRKRVLEVIKTTGYVSNMAAKTLREQHSHTIGLIIPNINNPFFSTIAYHVETYLFERQYSVFICNTSNDSEKEKRYFKNLAENRVSGILCISGQKEFQENIFNHDIPVVYIDRKPNTQKNVSLVCNDNGKASEAATEHLIQKGCKRIIFIPTPHTKFGKVSRQKGFENALEKNKIKLNSQYILKLSGKNSADIEAENNLKNFIKKKLPFDGIITASEMISIGALRAVQKAGMKIPDDVKIIGFDNMSYSQMTTPTLSSIERNPKMMAEKACEILMGMINGTKNEQQEIIVPFYIMERESSK